MRGHINDGLRAMIGYAVLFFGLIANGLQRFRLLGFSINQRRLKRKYGITRDTPVLNYGPEFEESIRLNRGRAVYRSHCWTPNGVCSRTSWLSARWSRALATRSGSNVPLSTSSARSNQTRR